MRTTSAAWIASPAAPDPIHTLWIAFPTASEAIHTLWSGFPAASELIQTTRIGFRDVGDAIPTHHPANAAQRVAQILPGPGRNVIEPAERLVRIRRNGRTSLHDRDVVAAKVTCGAHRSRQILGANPLVHARPMVLGGQEVAERLERLGLDAFRQFLRSPGLANPRRCTITVALGQKHPRKREAALGSDRSISRKGVNRRGVTPLLPKTRLRPPAHQACAGPTRVVGNEGGISPEIGVGVGVAQDKPFDKSAGRRIVDVFFDRGRFTGLGLARQIDRVLYRCKIARQRRSWRSRGGSIDGFVSVCPGIPVMPGFVLRGLARMPRAGFRIGRLRIRFLPVLNMFGSGVCDRTSGKAGEDRDGKDTSQRPQALVHFVVPCEPAGTNVRSHDPKVLNRYEGYHAADE